MIGDSRTAASRIASAASNRTCVSRSACDGSLASAHGVVSAICKFVASINRKTDAAACVISSSSIAPPIGGRHVARQLSQPRRGLARRNEPALTILMRHRRDAADEVAEVVREIGVVAFVESLPRKIAVVAEDDFLHEVQSQRVDAMPLGGVERIDDRARVRLAHPLIVDGHETVREHLSRKRQPGAHQHGGPDDGVETRDVLADQVQIGRPPVVQALWIRAETNGCRVVDERVEPDVDDAVRIPG